MEHRVSANSVWIGRFDHYVSSQIGHLGLVRVVGIVGERERLIELDYIAAGEIPTARNSATARHVATGRIDHLSQLGFGSGQKVGALTISLAVRAGDDDLVPL